MIDPTKLKYPCYLKSANGAVIKANFYNNIFGVYVGEQHSGSFECYQNSAIYFSPSDFNILCDYYGYEIRLKSEENEVATYTLFKTDTHNYYVNSSRETIVMKMIIECKFKSSFDRILLEHSDFAINRNENKIVKCRQLMVDLVEKGIKVTSTIDVSHMFPTKQVNAFGGGAGGSMFYGN